MLYIQLDQNQIKILSLKKTLLGQFEIDFFEKKHEIDLLNKGKVNSVDFLASAIKEGVGHLSGHQNKEVFLILPHQSFHFMKAGVPSDIAPSAISAFVIDKARSTLSVEIDNCFWDYFIKENEKQKQVSFYAADAETVQAYAQTLQLLGLKIVSLLPDTLALFKLFEKTLRKEKKETMFYVSYTDNVLNGYLFDSGGPLGEEKWTKTLSSEETLETVLKEKKTELEAKNIQLNRLILSGEKSDTVRQDTFTKDVGVWTNPLKRIVPNFYEEYVKMLVSQTKPFPILSFDVCFGAFVFSQENKDFQLLKKPVKLPGQKKAFALPRIPLFRKEVLIFLVSAIISFLAFWGLSKTNINFSDIKIPYLTQQPTPTPAPVAPAPTPAPTLKREDIKIKVLNGSGTAGKASEVKELLTDKEYGEVLTDNAESFDYEQSVIQVKKSKSGAAELLKTDLGDSVESFKIETLDEEDPSDVVLIVGSDFK